MKRLVGICGVFAAAAMLVAVFGCREKELRQQLDDYLFEARWVWGFHGAALVAWNGHVIVTGGYGMANREFGDIHTAETKFFIGSITKQFTAAAVLELQEQGKLRLDDPISAYLPGYPQPAADRVTIHHLLSHQSGIPNYTDFPEVLLKRTSRISPARLLESISQWPLEFEPGTRFQYSNSNYIVLGAIIEEVSGQSYEAFLHHHILGPLGMDNSGYARREAGIPGRAEGYTETESRRVVEAVPIDHSVLHTAGALYSTVRDMLKWDSALSRPGEVLSEASLEAMFTPNRGNYGYGWFIDTVYGTPHVWHSGFIDGFNTVIERWPERGLLVVVFSNEDYAPVEKMARGLAAICFGKPYDFPIQKQPISLAPGRLEEYTGVYRVCDERHRYIFLEGDTLHTYVTGHRPGHILPQAIDTFFFGADNTKLLIFQRDSAGKVFRAIVEDQSGAFAAERVSDKTAARLNGHYLRGIETDPELWDRFTGVYQMETVLGDQYDDFNVTVVRRDDRLFVRGRYTDDVELFPRTPTEFFHGTSGFGMSFLIDSTGTVNGCVLRMAGAEVHGRKIE